MPPAGALRVLYHSDGHSFPPLDLWVEATDLKTPGSEPFKDAAYQE